MNKIEIPLDKRKILAGIFVCIIFWIIGAYFFITLADQQTRYNTYYVKFVGIACVLVMSLLLINLTKKFFDKNMGLIIDENGIFDNATSYKIGLIKWEDIILIQPVKINSVNCLLIYVENPEAYLSRFKGFTRYSLKWSLKHYGTPFSIGPNTLKYNFNDLEELLFTKFVEYKRIKQ